MDAICPFFQSGISVGKLTNATFVSLLFLNISKKFLQWIMWFNAEWFWSKLHPNWMFVPNGKIQFKNLMKFIYFIVKDNFYNLLSYFLYFSKNKVSLHSLKIIILRSLLYFYLYVQVQEFFYIVEKSSPFGTLKCRNIM